MGVGFSTSLLREHDRMQVPAYMDAAERSLMSLIPSFVGIAVLILLIGVFIARNLKGGASLRTAVRKTGAWSAGILAFVSIPIVCILLLGLIPLNWIIVIASLIWLWVLIATRACFVTP